jgi:hypothetical protein
MRKRVVFHGLGCINLAEDSEKESRKKELHQAMINSSGLRNHKVTIKTSNNPRTDKN